MVLTASRNLSAKLRNSPLGDFVELPVAAGVTIYKGAHVGLGVSGYAQPITAVTPATTLTGGDRYLGIADGGGSSGVSGQDAEDVDNSSGSNGDKWVSVQISGAYEHTLAGVAIGDRGKPVFASDDGTLTLVALGNAFAGWIEKYVSANLALIRMPGDANTGNPNFSRSSPSIETVAANIALLIHPSENPNGLIVHDAFALVTETFAGATQDQGIITLQDTAGTTLGVTFTPTDGGADAVGDKVEGVGTSRAAATGAAIVTVPAGLGVQAKVTQLSAGAGEQGAMKIILPTVIPGA